MLLGRGRRRSCCGCRAARSSTFGGSFILDPFARFLKLLALTGSAAAILMSFDYLARENQQKFEYPILILLATTGMLMLISAADLIALYLGLELMSLALYVVAAINRDSARSSEAGLKYFILGALSSGMLLYGASLVYGFTGTVSFAGIAKAANPGSIGLILGLVFLFAGFCFKVSAVPFHMWTPDVYEGAPTPITAFFAAAPKIAGIAMFVRTTIMAFPGIVRMAADRGLRLHRLDGARRFRGHRPAQYQAADGLFVDRAYGLRPHRPRRRHRGWRRGRAGLYGDLSGHDARHLRGHLGDARDGQMVEGIGDLAGFARTNPTMAFFLAMLLFSLAGIPPLAGFFAKFYVSWPPSRPDCSRLPSSAS